MGSGTIFGGNERNHHIISNLNMKKKENTSNEAQAFESFLTGGLATTKLGSYAGTLIAEARRRQMPWAEAISAIRSHCQSSAFLQQVEKKAIGAWDYMNKKQEVIGHGTI
ncbi:MAG: hypothetical protein BGO12_02070 [Verrucomicrobia bacterium 61-8]|nr:MAG: hypothetical protein BGO12_02070 [Verrucomicrobia bacterium 61-8]